MNKLVFKRVVMAGLTNKVKCEQNVKGVTHADIWKHSGCTKQKLVQRC